MVRGLCSVPSSRGCGVRAGEADDGRLSEDCVSGLELWGDERGTLVAR